ncbi:AGAP013105-PA-like protein [Anopheles sinensis]|uniref:AGAP013105-PA-like protein n=1 Tax=Anopheles sinensis TaxID=74873 RepID=A0A084VC42_ANOSI|nr:AGAP013105-PA-like protein [Anopheles sinensis]
MNCYHAERVSNGTGHMPRAVLYRWRSLLDVFVPSHFGDNMWQTRNTWVFLLLASVVSSGVYGLTCNFCQSSNNYTSCLKSYPVECTEAVVNVTNLLLAPHNPSLKAGVSPGPEMQCFQVNFTANGVTNYQMGCTFARSHICEGWTVPSQCRIVSGIATPNPQAYSSKPSVGPIPSTTPGGGAGSNSKYSTPSIGTSSRATSLKESGTTTTVYPTLSTEGLSSSTPRPDKSRANVVSLRLDLLLLLSMFHLWCQNL